MAGQPQVSVVRFRVVMAKSARDLCWAPYTHSLNTSVSSSQRKIRETSWARSKSAKAATAAMTIHCQTFNLDSERGSRIIRQPDRNKLAGAAHSDADPFYQSFQGLSAALAGQVLHFDFLHAEFHFAGQHGDHDHRDKTISGNLLQNASQRLAPHQLKRTIGVARPDAPKQQIEKAHRAGNEDPYGAVGARAAATKDKIGGLAPLPAFPKIGSPVLAIAVGLKHELTARVVESGAQGFAVASVALWTHKAEAGELVCQPGQNRPG